MDAQVVEQVPSIILPNSLWPIYRTLPLRTIATTELRMLLSFCTTALYQTITSQTYLHALVQVKVSFVVGFPFKLLWSDGVAFFWLHTT